MTRVLVLRPEPGASATVQRARKLGLDVLSVPLFSIQSLGWTAPEPSGFDGLLLTSANAVRHGGDQLQALRGLPVYAVGEVTSEEARGAGFDIAATGDNGVDRLLGSIEADVKLLHLCGADRRQPQGARRQITALPVYEAKAIESPGLGSLEDRVALIHSPRAGRRFAELVDDRTTVSIVAISSAAAKAAGDGWKTIEVAEQPNDDALLALAARLCNNSR